MQVHRSRADGAAARQADLGVPGARDQRAQHIERRAHLPNLVIWGVGADDLRRVQPRLRPGGTGRFDDLGAQTAQQFAQKARVGQARHVGEDERLVGEQSGRHQFEGRILGAADGDLSLQRRAADDGDLVH